MLKVGQIVKYKLTEKQRESINSTNNQGNGSANDLEELPGIITCVHGEHEGACVNLKVFVDGDQPDLWVTSVFEGANEFEFVTID